MDRFAALVLTQWGHFSLSATNTDLELRPDKAKHRSVVWGDLWQVIWWQAAAWLEYWPVLVQLSVSVRAASKQVWLQAERVYSALNKVLRAAAAAGCLHFTSVWLCTDSVFSAHNQTHRRGDTGRGQSWGIVTKYEEWSHEDIVRLHILHSPTAGEAGYRGQAWPRTWGRPLVTPGYLAAWCRAHT